MAEDAFRSAALVEVIVNQRDVQCGSGTPVRCLGKTSATM
jgi:hypothetical protein